MSTNNCTVYRRPDGARVNKRNDASRASSLHDTQAEAVAAARRLLCNSGGGELTTMGVDGRIRSKDTVAPGVPCPDAGTFTMRVPVTDDWYELGNPDLTGSGGDFWDGTIVVERG